MLDAVTNQATGALELEWSIYSYTQLHIDFSCIGVANLYEEAIRSNLVLNSGHFVTYYEGKMCAKKK